MQDARCKELLRDVAFIRRLLGLRQDAEVIGYSLSHAGAKGLAGCWAPFFIPFHERCCRPKAAAFQSVPRFLPGATP